MTYLKLKPINPRNLTYGDIITDDKSRQYTFVALSTSGRGDRCLILERKDQIMYGNASEFYQRPLEYIVINGDYHAVYVGDRVYSKEFNCWCIVQSGLSHLGFVKVHHQESCNTYHCKMSTLLFEKPVTKHTRWLNIYPNTKDNLIVKLCVTRGDADAVAENTRIDCVCIEWTE